MGSLSVPLHNLGRRYANHKEEYQHAVDTVMRSGDLHNHPIKQELEKKLAEACDRRFCYLVNSGTAALGMAWSALGPKAGTPVHVTPFSFIASMSSILRWGGVPVFTDVYENTQQMDLGTFGADQSQLLLAVHMHGQMIDVEDLQRTGCSIVEDAAQAFGATQVTKNGLKKAGSLGEISCLSFSPPKVITGFASGGAILTDNPDLAEKIPALRRHGSLNGQYQVLGTNEDMDSITAALLSVSFGHWEDWQKRRSEIAEFYSEQLGKWEVQTPVVADGNTHNWHKYVIRVKQRDELQGQLAQAGVETKVNYSRPMYQEPGLLGSERSWSTKPVAEQVCQEVLSLPIYPELSDSEVEYVVREVGRALEMGSPSC